MDRSTEDSPTTHQPITETQKWRQDFPVDQPRDVYIARRDFTKFLVLISGAFSFGQFWIGVKSLMRDQMPTYPRRRIASVSEIPVGGFLSFEYPTVHDTCVLVRPAESVFLAYSNKCTHLMCPVIPKMEEGHFHCPCHEGYFDLQTGRPTAGPPRRPLPRVTLAVEGGAIYATGLEIQPR